MIRLFVFSFILFSFSGCRFKEDKPVLSPKPVAEDIAHFTSPLANSNKKLLKKAKSKKSPINPLFYKEISLCINDNVSVKDALIAICKQLGVDLQLSTNISGSFLFQATKRPMIEVIDDLCDIASLQYRIRGKSLFVDADKPYMRNYHLQFLNLSRTSQNRISVATDVFSNPENQAPTSGDNGSNSEVKHESKSDFWKEIEGNLKSILAGQGTFTLHKQGGIVCINAKQKLHKQVNRYITQLRKVSASQVLIEAKIVEVTLNDQYRSGINWQKLTGGDLRFDANFGSLSRSQASLNLAQSATDFVSLGMRGRTFAGILQALKSFGSSRTISSPRLTVMNNQSALLKVAQNQVYFRLNYDRSFYNNNNRESVNVSSDIQTVPIGLVMAVQPSIDEENGEIILSLRPTISRLAQSIRDPAVDVALSNSTNKNDIVPSLVPIVEVREIDSILRLRDGEIAVLGGLMEVRSRYNNSKVPIVGEIPVAGELFKSTSEGDEVVELVILLKAYIIPVSESASPNDEDNRLLNYVPSGR
jgi:MSHA type pilus biogenesis protein MshL